MWLILKAAALACTATAHMPKFGAAGSVDNPEDLGDITLNSWAVNKVIKPDEVHYFKIKVPKTPKNP